MLTGMRQGLLVRVLGCGLVLACACDEPQVGSPGLEPPRPRDREEDAGEAMTPRMPSVGGQGGSTGAPIGSLGGSGGTSVPPPAGMSSAGTNGAAGAGGAPASAGSGAGASGAAGAGAEPDADAG